MIEHFFTCPYCWETISMLIDVSIKNQEYIEDCEVCCNPIKVLAVSNGLELTEFEAKSME
ncbi:CPXCG motif-containing cysteine-rich protein [Mangrovimonas sp. ST2L15]|uniref:CPXCG motif-containing cysteine-rich protein n=1 Tax=Mangrovimonas sp. ST2L15 TaxID=1645916 RepID=UPI0006B47915|nr:CPXCG motif-containing cysteine-rich protein [Mangrovimonas sp. ST2L15]